jgi:hypothetical protein
MGRCQDLGLWVWDWRSDDENDATCPECTRDYEEHNDVVFCGHDDCGARFCTGCAGARDEETGEYICGECDEARGEWWCFEHNQLMYNKDGLKCGGCMDADDEDDE